MKNTIFQIIKIIKRKKLKISVAESCTGGMLSNTITSISGVSMVFNMGLVTYSNQAKTSILKVPKKIIQKHEKIKQELTNYKKKKKDEQSKVLEFSEKIDELNQETDTLLEDIDKWQM